MAGLRGAPWKLWLVLAGTAIAAAGTVGLAALVAHSDDKRPSTIEELLASVASEDRARADDLHEGLTYCVQAVELTSSGTFVRGDERITEAGAVAIEDGLHRRDDALPYLPEVSPVDYSAVDRGCPSLPSGELVAYREPWDVPVNYSYLVTRAGFYYHFVFVMNQDDMDTFLGSGFPRVFSHEIACSGDLCAEVSDARYVTLKHLGATPDP